MANSMSVSIDRIVEDINNKVTIENVIYEAIANSIQANADSITIKLEPCIVQSTESNINQKINIDNMVIEDNGDGFTQENIKSFNTYKSSYKKQIGCKGVGRFLFLKIFEYIKIKSKNCNIYFSKNAYEYKETSENYLTTQIFFNNSIKNQVINVKQLEKNIKKHFLAHFKMLGENNKVVNFKILFKNDTVCSFSSSDIPNFYSKEFMIEKNMFKISYLYNDKTYTNNGYYCANGRVVVSNGELDKDRRLDLPKDIKIFFVLESDFLNNNVNDERNEFNIYPKLTGELHHTLSWSDIHSKLLEVIKEICRDNNFDIDNTIELNRLEGIEKFPFLSSYFSKCNDLNMESMIKNAHNLYNEDKEFIRNLKSKKDSNYKNKLYEVTRCELAEYIFDRDRILKELKQAVDDKAKEVIVHNLFMKQKTSSENSDYKSNNMWLFDDRFMSYDKIFSDKQIKQIFPQFYSEVRPDILSIISNTYDKNEITDILLIEFKRPECDERKAAEAEFEILKYARFIQKSELKNSKIRIWAYAFLKFDNETMEALNDKGYNSIFTSHKYPIRYLYNSKNNVIINFLDYDALICDAENRNKLFLNILKGTYIKSNK